MLRQILTNKLFVLSVINFILHLSLFYISVLMFKYFILLKSTACIAACLS